MAAPLDPDPVWWSTAFVAETRIGRIMAFYEGEWRLRLELLEALHFARLEDWYECLYGSGIRGHVFHELDGVFWLRDLLRRGVPDVDIVELDAIVEARRNVNVPKPNRWVIPLAYAIVLVFTVVSFFALVWITSDVVLSATTAVATGVGVVLMSDLRFYTKRFLLARRVTKRYGSD